MAKGLQREHEELNNTKPSTSQNQDEKADGRILLRLTVRFGIAVYNLFDSIVKYIFTNIMDKN